MPTCRGKRHESYALPSPHAPRTAPRVMADGGCIAMLLRPYHAWPCTTPTHDSLEPRIAFVSLRPRRAGSATLPHLSPHHQHLPPHPWPTYRHIHCRWYVCRWCLHLSRSRRASMHRCHHHQIAATTTIAAAARSRRQLRCSYRTLPSSHPPRPPPLISHRVVPAPPPTPPLDFFADTAAMAEDKGHAAPQSSKGLGIRSDHLSG